MNNIFDILENKTTKLLRLQVNNSVSSIEEVRIEVLKYIQTFDTFEIDKQSTIILHDGVEVNLVNFLESI